MDGPTVFAKFAPECTPPNTCFLWPILVQIPNGISIGSDVFAGFTTVTDRQTDRQTTLLGR